MGEIHEKIIYTNDLGDSIQISYSFPYFLQELRGVDGVDSLIQKTKNYHQDGYLDYDSSLQDRPLQIIGIIKASDKAEAGRHREKLFKVFNPKEKGILQYEYGDIKKRIECQIERAPKFQKKSNSFKRQIFMIDLLCPSPYWQDINESKEEIALWKGSFHFPLVIPQEGIIMGYREPSLIVNVKNMGHVQTGMKIEFIAKGTLKNPSLFDINTRKFLKINRIMTPGEKIIVNTNSGKKGVKSYLNGVTTDILNDLDIAGGGRTFLQLNTGDNLFRYDAEEGIDNLEVRIYYNNNYLGV